MLPHTENWKPAWRFLHRAGCVLAAFVLSVLFFVQISWVSGAFYRPHRLLEKSIGEPLWTALTIEYYDGVSIRGGTRAWDLKVSQQDAERLRARCGDAVGVRSIAKMRIPVKLIILPDGMDISDYRPTDMKRVIDAGKKLPQGCVLGSERDKEGKAGSQTALIGNLIRIEEWVD